MPKLTFFINIDVEWMSASEAYCSGKIGRFLPGVKDHRVAARRIEWHEKLYVLVVDDAQAQLIFLRFGAREAQMGRLAKRAKWYSFYAVPQEQHDVLLAGGVRDLVGASEPSEPSVVPATQQEEDAARLGDLNVVDGELLDGMSDVPDLAQLPVGELLRQAARQTERIISSNGPIAIEGAVPVQGPSRPGRFVNGHKVNQAAPQDVYDQLDEPIPLETDKPSRSGAYAFRRDGDRLVDVMPEVHAGLAEAYANGLQQRRERMRS